jgi:hypothetical protein
MRQRSSECEDHEEDHRDDDVSRRDRQPLPGTQTPAHACDECHHSDDEEQNTDALSHGSNRTNDAQRLLHPLDLGIALLLELRGTYSDTPLGRFDRAARPPAA